MAGDIRLRLEFDLYREPGAMLWSEWRRTAAIEKVGPCFYIEKDGQLLLNEKRPAGGAPARGQSGSTFEITDGSGRPGRCPLGDEDHRSGWPRAVRGHGSPLLRARLDRLLWLGFVGNGTEPAEMYIDNISLRRVEP